MTSLPILSLTHDDALAILEGGTLPDNTAAILVDYVAEAEESAICDDVFVEIDRDTQALLDLVRARGVQHQVH